MKFKSPLISQGSGKVAGLVFSHNRSGNYTRNWRKPVNPNTSFQQVVRNAMSSLQTRFGQTLTAAQRLAWATYGENVPRTNTLGESIKLTGQQWYVACNTYRLQAGLTVVDAGPVVFEMATLTLPVPTITPAGTSVSLAYTNTDTWAGEVGGALLLYSSRAQNNTKNFFAGPYRFAGKVAGAGTPPTSPAVITMPFPSGPAASFQFFRAIALRADGRFSPTLSFRGIA